MENEESQTPNHGAGPGGVKLEERLKYQFDELKIRIETYRFYFNLALQINGFFYLTTGAVLAFYLKEPTEPPASGHLVYFLLLPILIGSVLGGVFIYGARLQKDSSIRIERLRRDLNACAGLGIRRIPDIHLLRLLLLIFGSIFFLVTAALISVPYLAEVGSRAKPGVSGVDLLIFSAPGLVILIAGLCLGLKLLPFMGSRFDKGLNATVKRLSPSADGR